MDTQFSFWEEFDVDQHCDDDGDNDSDDDVIRILNLKT